MSSKDLRTYEVTFCSRVSKWADSIYENNPTSLAEVEQRIQKFLADSFAACN